MCHNTIFWGRIGAPLPCCMYNLLDKVKHTKAFQLTKEVLEYTHQQDIFKQ